ncbi:hypothetical protein [Thermobifida cellulosilytica]|uniref:Uncharacterized protein n=1 Tax=Thermobifida cellulosilytica TB100 TaxID=665004 RepID=A0A147KME8_THECS|nr:hypothetical protein [Thermobifida cellulosilytica]KUP98408.1 hypothetical protein AC529_01480 [Thermobifida cellulosilytica TB100]
MDVRELVWAVRAAPLVLRVQEFLCWLGEQRPLSREPLPGRPGARRHTYLSLGSWAEGRTATALGEEETALLEFLLAARMLEVVVGRRERRTGGGVREHAWVLPGPAYPLLPDDAARVWRTGVELLPLLWACRVPGASPGCPLPARWLERLHAADGLLPLGVLGAADGAFGTVRGEAAAALQALESLGLVRLRYDLDLGECCALTPLGRHAVTLLRRCGVLAGPQPV